MIAQLVQKLATGQMTKGLEFKSRYGQEFSFLCVHTSSGAHPPHIRWVLGTLSPMDEAGLYLQLLPGYNKNMDLYIPPPPPQYVFMA
jgi:hypothetical protein